VRHVCRLVDDLLDVSKVTCGKLQLRLDRLSLASVIARSIELASPALEQKQHRLTTNIPESVDVCGDAVRLAQVFSNLLTNAAKFTDSGGSITITGVREGPHIIVSVSDTGVGLSEPARQRIFEPFEQGQHAQGGLGLGLALARSLVELHGGSISAMSEGLGCGSTFAVTLPVAGHDTVSSARRDSTARTASALAQRVLVVDDNADAAEMLAEALAAHGYSATIAADGPTALREAARVQPHIAILDLGLPVMDGFELRQRLRQTHPALRCIAVTGYGQPLDRERTHAAGFEHHFVKPVLVGDLLTALETNATR